MKGIPIKINLDRTLAFTALLEVRPTLSLGQATTLSAELADVMTEANPKDRWAFAREWIAERISRERPQAKLVCGDCGDELTDNPDRGPGREVTVETSPRSGIHQQVTVYDRPAHLHTDDNTPACMGRADAEPQGWEGELMPHTSSPDHSAGLAAIRASLTTVSDQITLMTQATASVLQFVGEAERYGYWGDDARSAQAQARQLTLRAQRVLAAAQEIEQESRRL